MLTRKHFAAIAATLKACKPVDDAPKAAHDTWAITCRSLSFTLARENPAFNHARFLAACGLE